MDWKITELEQCNATNIEPIIEILKLLLSYAQPIGDLCIIFITIYTFYLTYFSLNIKYIGGGFGMNLFEGSYYKFVFQSRTLQTIRVKSILLHIKDGSIIEFELTNPVVIEGRRSVEIQTDRFTKISGIDNPTDLTFELYMVVLKTDNGSIFIKLGLSKLIPNIILRVRYSKGYYQSSCTISAIKIADMVISSSVKFVIHIIDYHKTTTILMTADGLTNMIICGHNAFSLPSQEPSDIQKYFSKLLEIPIDRIIVETYNNSFFD